MVFYKRFVIITGVLIFFFAGCASSPNGYDSRSAIAVWDLENLSPSENIQPNLEEFFTSKIVEILVETGNYEVIERQRLILSLEELNLGTSALVDESTRLRVGRMLGARLMVFGSYQFIADQMRLDLRLVEVESGRILKAVQKITSGSNLSDWLNAAADAAAQLF
ncbi:MAG: hypothetical protein JW786_09335 [Desulfobacterales bacterium]|nr:hypothetical protein [Desulfobacterales bacterium]